MAESDFVKRASRLPLDVEVNCDGSYISYSKDISESGIAIITDAELEVGKFIQMKFHLPGVETEINAYGKVARSAAVSDNFFECGISFWDIAEEDKEALQEFFKKSIV
ncbi:MAG: PilZ domain-containing protein [Spirochaetales bacterium]|nr:PilZ domain-containing protein [Spirochaetales bacterium]